MSFLKFIVLLLTVRGSFILTRATVLCSVHFSVRCLMFVPYTFQCAVLFFEMSGRCFMCLLGSSLCVFVGSCIFLRCLLISCCLPFLCKLMSLSCAQCTTNFALTCCRRLSKGWRPQVMAEYVTFSKLFYDITTKWLYLGAKHKRCLGSSCT